DGPRSYCRRPGETPGTSIAPDQLRIQQQRLECFGCLRRRRNVGRVLLQLHERTVDDLRLTILIDHTESVLSSVRLPVAAAPAHLDLRRLLRRKFYGRPRAAREEAVEVVLPLDDPERVSCPRLKDSLVVPSVRKRTAGRGRDGNAAEGHRIEVDSHVEVVIALRRRPDDRTPLRWCGPRPRSERGIWRRGSRRSWRPWRSRRSRRGFGRRTRRRRHLVGWSHDTGRVARTREPAATADRRIRRCGQ